MFFTAVVRAVDDPVFSSITQTLSCALLLNAFLSPCSLLPAPERCLEPTRVFGVDICPCIHAYGYMEYHEIWTRQVRHGILRPGWICIFFYSLRAFLQHGKCATCLTQCPFPHLVVSRITFLECVGC
jgi:hypothetical protein